MSNSEYFNLIKDNYPSLKFFTLRNNILSIEVEGYTNHIPLLNVKLEELSALNPEIFYIEPITIFNIIYLLELLYKPNLTPAQTSFIESYMHQYNALNDEALSGNDELMPRVNILKIPIFRAYDDIIKNNPAGILIERMDTSHIYDNENGKNKQLRLVRTNKTVSDFLPIDEDNPYVDFGKAGFTTLILIGSAIAATVSYITYFILGH